MRSSRPTRPSSVRKLVFSSGKTLDVEPMQRLRELQGIGKGHVNLSGVNAVLLFTGMLSAWNQRQRLRCPTSFVGLKRAKKQPSASSLSATSTGWLDLFT